MAGMTRICSIFALLLVSLGSIAAPMGVDDAQLLLRRAGFGGNQRQIAEYAALTREQAVDRLLAGGRTGASTPAPEWVNDPVARPGKLKDLTEEDRKALLRDLRAKSVELRGWWMHEMIVTPSPLTERMTLFWHNHFVSSQQKVKSPPLMYRQNLLLRRHALGNFADLLHAVSKDSAMIIYLDTAANRSGQPNENFAREVMELFTLGEGHYTESDVKEAARAFTGWSIERETFAFRFRPFVHDQGIKTVLGRTGNFDGDQVLDILLAQPATAEFVTAKLWREFISPKPDPVEVARIARSFRTSGYSIQVALRAILTSDAMYAANNRASLVKSPVDLIVGTLHQFDIETGDALPFAIASRQFGQDLFAPPNVKGWPGGETWINSTTLLGRKQFLDRLFQVADAESGMRQGIVREAMPRKVSGDGDAPRGKFARAVLDVRFDSTTWLGAVGSGSQGNVERLLLAAAPVNPIPADARGADLIRRVTQDPVYQLK